jgi:hypothetical protein
MSLNLWDPWCEPHLRGVGRLHASTAASYVVPGIGRRGRFDCRPTASQRRHCRQRRQTMGDGAFTALTTARLVLRRFRPEDLDTFVAYRSDPVPPSTRATATRPRRSAGCCTTCSSSEASIGSGQPATIATRAQPPCWGGWACAARATCWRAPGPRASGPTTCCMPSCGANGHRLLSRRFGNAPAPAQFAAGAITEPPPGTYVADWQPLWRRGSPPELRRGCPGAGRRGPAAGPRGQG